MVVFALLGIRLPFRVIYGETLLVPHPSLSVSSMGKVLAHCGSEGETPGSPLPSPCLELLCPHISLWASDLGDIVVGKQALLASQSTCPPAGRICGGKWMR